MINALAGLIRRPLEVDTTAEHFFERCLSHAH